MLRFPALAAWAILACGPESFAAESGGPAQSPATAGIGIAHSALLTLDATPAEGSLALHIRRVHDQTLVSSSDVTATVDGKSEPLTRGADGSYVLPTSDLRGEEAHTLEVVVGHDGIREVMTGKLALPESASSPDLLRHHKQIGWWILNVLIVLIAVIALSRRKRS